MADARVSRLVTEVTGEPGLQAGVTRAHAEVAGQNAANATDDLKVSRLVVEVVGDPPDRGALSRGHAEVAGRVAANATDSILVSRLVAEVVGGQPNGASFTRAHAEVAGQNAAAGATALRVSRLAGEVAARRGAAGPVVPLALAANDDLFLHNWVSEVELRSSYLNDISISSTGAEARTGLSLKPRRRLRLRWENDNRARLERMYIKLVQMTDERTQVPLYSDQRDLAAVGSADTVIPFDTTLGRWFVGGRVVLVELDSCHSFVQSVYRTIVDKNDSQIELDSAVGVDLPAGSVIYPVMDMEITFKPTLDLTTARRATLQVTLDEVPGASALPPMASDLPPGAQSFESVPIWTVEPDWSRPIEYGRDRQGIKGTLGRADFVSPLADRSRTTHRFRVAEDRTGAFEVIRFFDTRRGSLRNFWHIDQLFTWDVIGIDASGQFVSIEPTGDLASVQAEVTNEWVGLVMKDGTHYVREVTLVQDLTTSYRFTVTPVLPAGLAFQDVVRFARARKTRFATDELRETWRNLNVMQTEIRTIETLREDNVDT